MKYVKTWSHKHYRPLLFNSGDVYVNRISPFENGATVEWNSTGSACEVYLADWKSFDFKRVATTEANSYCFTDLTSGKDYWFYVKCGDKSSLKRVFRTGNYEGNVVNYLHPDDGAYAFSGLYVCSPSLVKLPDGALLASHDVYGPESPQSFTMIFRSDDGGKSWHHACELFPAFWTKLFVHRGVLYALACSTEYGDLLIGRSTDGGYTFDEPTVLLRGGNGKGAIAGVHKNPQPVVEHDGRIWETLEYGSWNMGYHVSMVMSASVDADLMDSASWSFSEPVKYDPSWEGVPKGPSSGTIEGTLTVRNGTLYNVMRYDMKNLEQRFGKAIRFKVNTSDPEAPIAFDKCIDFPANATKFAIKYDEVSKKFYTIGCNLLESGLDIAKETFMPRNHLCLFTSPDLDNWSKACDLIDYRNYSPAWYGFQYADFIFDGEDIIYLVRTATNGAMGFHDSNALTFRTLKNFRSL